MRLPLKRHILWLSVFVLSVDLIVLWLVALAFALVVESRNPIAALPALTLCTARIYQETALLNIEGEVIALLNQGVEMALIGTTADGEFMIAVDGDRVGFIWHGAAVAAEGDCLRGLQRFRDVLPDVESELLTPDTRDG